jgi:hypothetical protein
MRQHSKTESAKLKVRIQALVRAIVIKRDKGCFLKGFRFQCNEVLQADHLVTRGKNVGFADTRIIICLCKGHHTAKTFDKSGEYEEEIKRRLPPENVVLWERAKKDHKIYPMSAYDWGKEAIALEYELGQMV